MSADFADLWKLRNRPSRLKDNMAGFDAVVSEIEAPIRKA